MAETNEPGVATPGAASAAENQAANGELLAKKAKEIEEALASFPVLKEAYLTTTGQVFFDKTTALKFEPQDEKLKVIPNKHYKEKEAK